MFLGTVISDFFKNGDDYTELATICAEDNPGDTLKQAVVLIGGHVHSMPYGFCGDLIEVLSIPFNEVFGFLNSTKSWLQMAAQWRVQIEK
jgi:hypothetical protein